VGSEILYEELFMKTISINLPDFIDLNEKEIKLLIATKLYEEGKLSLGEAAQLAELSKRAFIEILGRFDISLFNYNAEELRNDVKNA
jgi:predicted HTH domain antitoxin